jgi:transketolase
MRKAFIKALTELDAYLITADMGMGLIEPFAEKFPDRFINVGVAEQNMIGVATGLALSGKKVFVYSIANFPTMRCLEQIRNDICYHNLPVCIVAGGTGLAYGQLGSSHHATEDIAAMRTLPNMNVIAPSSKSETLLATRAIYEIGKPCYLRLGWLDEAKSDNIRSFQIGKAVKVVAGSDIAIITTGSMLDVGMEAVEKLLKLGFKPILMNMHTVKPIDEEAIINVSRISKVIITIEEHSIIGGLGSAIAEVIADNYLKIRLIRMGIPDIFCIKVADRQGLLKYCSLTLDDIVEKVLNAIK